MCDNYTEFVCMDICVGALVIFCNKTLKIKYMAICKTSCSVSGEVCSLIHISKVSSTMIQQWLPFFLVPSIHCSVHRLSPDNHLVTTPVQHLPYAIAPAVVDIVPGLFPWQLPCKNNNTVI